MNNKNTIEQIEKHKNKEQIHKINLEEIEKIYKRFFSQEDNENLELSLCKDFEKLDYESLLLCENNLGE